MNVDTVTVPPSVVASLEVPMGGLGPMGMSSEVIDPLMSSVLDAEEELAADSTNAFSYDEVFPALPEVEALNQAHSTNPLGKWSQRMKLKTSEITQVFRVPVEERKYQEINSGSFGVQGQQSRICADIMSKTGATIEISSSKDQSLTIVVTGKEEAVSRARRLIVAELQTQASATIQIPKEHYRFILGKSAKKLTDLELQTSTKIHVPRPGDNSDYIEIRGTKEGIDKAKHEIQLISDEQAKLALERLDIPKVFHTFITGPFGKYQQQLADETGARINIPPPSVMKDEITVAGEKEAVAKAKDRILAIYNEKKRSCQTVSVEEHGVINTTPTPLFYSLRKSRPLFSPPPSFSASR